MAAYRTESGNSGRVMEGESALLGLLWVNRRANLTLVMPLHTFGENDCDTEEFSCLKGIGGPRSDCGYSFA